MNIFTKLIAVIIMVSVVSSLGLVGVADTATSNACDYFLNNKYRINSKVSCGDCYGLRLYSFSNGKFTVTGNSTVQERMGKSNAFSTYNSTKEHSYQCTVEVIKLLSVGSPSISASGFSSGVSVNTFLIVAVIASLPSVSTLIF